MQRHCREAQTYFGATIECDLSDLLQRCIYHFGVWEPHISALIESRLRPGDIFCDVGANIGYDSLLGSSVVGPTGKVIAIEASPTIYGRLLNNLRLNRVTNVETVQIAITAELGEIPIYKGYEWNIGTASIIESRGHELEAMVRGLPLLNALSAEDRKHLRLVKIDVEGAELPILRQLADSIGEYSAELEVIVEVKPDATPNAGLQDVFDHFRTLGFSAFPQGGSVMGGWSPSPGSVGPTVGLPAAGIDLQSTGGTTALNNAGSIGALSDLAVTGDPMIVNNGVITGFVQFSGASNSIVNNGTFNLRDFEDTDGDGVRDTKRVAIADLGPGATNTFSNNGVLALAPVSGATTLDNTAQHLPLGNANNAMSLSGIVQGQLLGVATFTNSGTIDLQANPAAGDVLVITGGHTAGTSGGGNFVSNGGVLKIDTVFNTGGAAAQSDVLVVDGTTVGPKGATKVFVRDAGGGGALTVGDGIPVVQVLDVTRSASGAFALGAPIDEGPFEYLLFHGGPSGANPADWFLRSDFTVPPTPEPAPPFVPPSTSDPFPAGPPPAVLQPGGTYPIVGPRLSAYGVVQPIARQIGLTTLGTLHERIGDTLTVGNAGPGAEGWLRSTWGRVIGQQIDNHYQAYADPRASGRLIGLQFGVDVWRGSFSPGNRDVAGLYFGYLNGDMNVDGLITNPAATAYVLQRTGTLNLNSYSLGGYWTHYGPGGWYLDGVLQGTRYGGDATAQFNTLGLTTTLPTQGSGFVSSLEGGYSVPLTFGPGFVLEPQAQIIWQEVDFDHASDGIATIALGSTSGVTGRLGVRGQWTIPGADGEVWQPYGRFNIWRDWGGNAATSFSGSGIGVPLVGQATRLELAGGLTFKLQANLSFYTQLGYQFAVAPTNAGRDGIKGDIGLRYTW